MLADYAEAYHGPPAPTMPWPLFLTLARRTGRYEARRLLAIMDGTSWGAATLFAGSNSSRLQHERHTVSVVAYPSGDLPAQEQFEQAAFAAMQADPPENIRDN